MRRASALDEEPVYLAAGAEHVFGILTRPVSTPTGLGVVCLHARNRNNTAHRNQTGMRLARELAAVGAYTLRVDFYGTGDSTGVLQRGVTGQVGEDLLAAVEHLRRMGVTRIAVAGICYGGLVSLANADRIPELTGLFMVSPPFATMRPGQTLKRQHDRLAVVARQTVRGSTLRLLLRDRSYRAWLLHRVRLRLRHARRGWVEDTPVQAPAPPTVPGLGPGVTPLAASMRWLEQVLARGISVGLLFAESDRIYQDFLAARDGELGRLLDSPQVEVVVAPGNEFGLLTSLAGQEMIIRSTLEWATQRCSGPATAPQPQ